MQVLILRGLPGSGKSRFAKSILGAFICSADDYHMVNGEYKFDPKNAGFAHIECTRKFIGHLGTYKNDAGIMIVDNTNTTLMEISPYVRLADVYGVPFEIIYFPCDLITAHKRNVHNVPIGTLMTMERNLINEIPPPFWPQKLATA